MWTNSTSWISLLTLIYLIFCLTALFCRRSASWARFCWFVNSVTWHHFIPPTRLQGVIVIHLNTLLSKLQRLMLIITITIITIMRMMRKFKKQLRKKWFWYQITFMEHDNCPKFHNHTVKITIRWLLQYVENSEEKLIAKGDKKEYYQELNIVPLHIIKKGGKTTFMKEKLLHGKFVGNSFAKFTEYGNGFRKGLWRRKQKDYYWQVRNKP